jgi:dTDP-4-amino-4,6-dideoxygalactose transaminase
MLPAWPSFAEDEVAAAAAVLRSGRVSYWTGDEGRQFEKEFAAYIGCAHAVAVANGTVALELALRALEVGAGDEVVIPSRSYFATASAVVAVGARPVFADVDRDSQNLTAATIQAAVSPRTKAVIVVHLAGWPSAMGEILHFTSQHGLSVVEDCAQAHGATLNGQRVGSFGDIGTFSFCQDKIMTTAGEGGMVTTSSDELWKRMWAYKDHGKSYETVYGKNHPPGFRWQHDSFGTNWRLTEVQSAIGRRQLGKLPAWLAARRRNAHRLVESFRTIRGLRIPVMPDEIEHAFYKCYAFVAPEQLGPGWDRDRIAQSITALGVPCSTGSCSEIYLEAAFPAEWRPAQRLPGAKELGETSLMFQVHPTLTKQHIDRMCEVVGQVMSEATNELGYEGSTQHAS